MNAMTLDAISKLVPGDLVKDTGIIIGTEIGLILDNTYDSTNSIGSVRVLWITSCGECYVYVQNYHRLPSSVGGTWELLAHVNDAGQEKDRKKKRNDQNPTRTKNTNKRSGSRRSHW